MSKDFAIVNVDADGNINSLFVPAYNKAIVQTAWINLIYSANSEVGTWLHFNKKFFLDVMPIALTGEHSVFREYLDGDVFIHGFYMRIHKNQWDGIIHNLKHMMGLDVLTMTHQHVKEMFDYNIANDEEILRVLW